MILVTVVSVEAVEELVDEDGIDIMIIIDKSLSMSWHDPYIETLEATNHLLNLSLGTGNRVGFVVYNDTIVAYQGLRTIETVDDIDEIMIELHGLRISRGTDIGLALQAARRQLNLDNYRWGRTAIIFLSDGEYELEWYNPNRNQSDVMADVDDVIANISYPVFNIQYSILEYRDEAPKNEWGELTGGASFTAMTSDEMMGAINEIYHQIVEMARVELLMTELAMVEEGAQENEVELVVGEINVYEHQLVISIQQAETKRAEMVEVTLKGDGLLQEVIIPANHEHINVNMIGTNHIITVTDPVLESYTIYYFSDSEIPLENSIVTRMVEIRTERQMPWEIIGIGVSGIAVLVFLALLASRIVKKQQQKKLYPELNATLECYFMEIPTGVKDIPIQSWSASYLASNKKKSLYNLLKSVPLRNKMPEAEKIFASINIDSTISITNKADIVCYKNGREVKADKGITLRNGEGLYMVFQKNTIEIELRARKNSFS